MLSTASPIWRPFTQMKTAVPPLMVRSANGIYLELEDGRRIMDCISSWWVNIHGHAQPDIARAIYEQALNLEQVIFAGFTHEPAELLADRLVKKLPGNIEKVFYSDNGSTAVEVALKMSYQYWRNHGIETRNRFIAFDGGYHGDTLGAMSVGKGAKFWKTFNNILCPVDLVDYPETFDGDVNVAQTEENSLHALRKLLERDSESYAAICIEPLVQGAGGMRMCRPQFLRALINLARSFDVLVIYDEVMTGFGRTGDWFAAIKSGTQPDIICISKGITGGFLPLAVTAASERIFQAFYDDDQSKALFHGHSYTANPVACAAALKSLDLLEIAGEPFRVLEEKHRLYANVLDGMAKLAKKRFCGTIAAFDLKTSEGNNYFDAVGLRIRQSLLEKGFLIRPLGNTVYLMPPYCITDGELEAAYKAIAKTVQELDA